MAKTRDTSGNPLVTLGIPTVSWNGGGGNGIKFNSANINMMATQFPYNPLAVREINQ